MEGAQKSEKEKEARQMPACHVTILFVASAEERPRGSRLERPAEGQRVMLLTRDALAWLALPADGYDADHGPSLNQRRKGLGTWANLERLGSPIESRSLRHTVTLCVNVSIHVECQPHCMPPLHTLHAWHTGAERRGQRLRGPC